jgi:hypothetical protein
MQASARGALDGFLAVLHFLMDVVMDVSLLAVCRAHFRHALALDGYRPVFSSSGRHNRVRY